MRKLIGFDHSFTVVLRRGAVAVLTTVFVFGLLSGLLSDARSGPIISLVGQLDLPGQPIPRNSDIWGWVDSQTNKEYAIVGKWPSLFWNGGQVFLIDVSTPSNPVLKTTLDSVPSFDMKTWGDYLYLVDGNGSNKDGYIYDISNPLSPTFEGTFASAHNIFISDNGYMYNEVSGLSILDLNADPTDPPTVWRINDGGGHDALVKGNILYDFHGYIGTNIYDVTNPASPVLLGSITDTITYHHSGSISPDGKYLTINDELSIHPAPDITVWDVSTPASPVKVGEYADPNHTVHNSFQIGDYLYTSYYTAGFRIFNMANPPTIALLDEYDTSAVPGGDRITEGNWGVYPFAPSGYIYVSDMQEGLFIFSVDTNPATAVPRVTSKAFSLSQNYPNPFRPTTTITYDLLEVSHVTLEIYDVRGRKIRTLVDSRQNRGPGHIRWNGIDDHGQPVASGVYYYRLDAGGLTDTKKMILLK